MVAITMLRNWKVLAILGLAFIVLFIWGPWRGDGDGEDGPVAQVLPSARPELTTPPPTMRSETPIKEDATTTTTAPKTNECRWILLTHQYLYDLEVLSARIAEINQQWDDRDVSFRETVRFTEEWVEAVSAHLSKDTATAEGAELPVAEWRSELNDAAEDVLDWLKSSERGSADKRRAAAAQFDSLTLKPPFMNIGC